MDGRAMALRAVAAATALRASTDEQRRGALRVIADALAANADAIVAANERDLRADLDPSVKQRLALDHKKLEATIAALRSVADLPDPTGKQVYATKLDHDLRLQQVTVPLGVVACIFESRPDVCIQIPALTLRSGNAVLLKGGSEAQHTNQLLAETIRAALATTDLPVDAVQAVASREEIAELLACDDLIDLIVPRGSNELVRFIQDNTRIPVMGHAAGICHIYVDAAADLAKAKRIVLDAKLDYPSACNAVETVLVHAQHGEWLAEMVDTLQEKGAVVHQQDADFDREYGMPELNVRLVADLPEALQHIARHGSKHTEAIITEDDAAWNQFLVGVDAAGIFRNASTRFADGHRYGLGAEVGISTGKLHARGPVGLAGLVTTRWILQGDGHTVADFADRSFLHEQP